MPYGSFDEGFTTMEEYKKAGINTVVMLTSDEENFERSGLNLKKLYAENGIEVIYLPIVDFDVPKEDSGLEDALQLAVAQAAEGKNLAVHCYAGRGRTGMFAALLARRILGLDGQKAIEWVRQYFPAIETDAQAKRVVEDEGRDCSC
ncbi:MAG: hypothetical protein HN357_06535 [Chloroflexi bacterium]|jgi:protein-tyrosine phosphatase|nr:hypothetical protein [Chloroflexota bacterium]MBT3668799.1 hypothetical protein [Chloroflexota bacterium]MBT4003820.1 hypothetical protein [Chloroflexota bacterium]MBT6356977.1 hypothetical protein [Chloroflexota bacterium]MBT7218091.1 hypothetical protein [Chloroflexota bacterium]